jgi:hypothetical protein
MDFDRVCETQVGFGGATAYGGGPGIHPVVLFADWGEPPSLLESSATLPAGWKVEQDMDFNDNSELAAAQLVACARRTATTATGISCEFNLSSGEEISLELTDTVYELSVYEATTGEQVGETQTIEASATECPFSAVFREGDTQVFNDPTDDQYVNALKEFVAP